MSDHRSDTSKSEIIQSWAWRNPNAEYEPEDMTSVIHTLKRDETKFLFLSMEGKSMPTHNPEFEWMIYKRCVPIVDMTGATFSGTGANRVLRLPRSRELKGWVKNLVCMVRDVNGVTGAETFSEFRTFSNPVENGEFWEISLRKRTKSADGRDVEIPLVASDDALIIGKQMHLMHTSVPEGTDEMNPITRTIESMRNTVTTFDEHTMITLHKAATLWEPDITYREFQLRELLLEFKRRSERSLMFGKHFKGIDTASEFGGRGLYSGKGLVDFIPSENKRLIRQDSAKFMDFIEYAEDIVAPNNVGKEAMDTWINSSMLSYLVSMLNQEDKTLYHWDPHATHDVWGFRIRKLVTPHMDFNLRVNEAMNEMYGKEPVMICTDMEGIKTRYMSANGVNLGTMVLRDVQNKNAKYISDNVYGTIGLQVDLVDSQSMLRFYKVS